MASRVVLELQGILRSPFGPDDVAGVKTAAIARIVLANHYIAYYKTLLVSEKAFLPSDIFRVFASPLQQ